MAQRATFNCNFVCSPSKARKTGEAPIELSISINGKRTYIQLPKKCKPEDFNRLINAKHDNDIKTYCQTILARVNEIQTNLTVNNQPITPARIKDYFKNGATTNSYTLGELFADALEVKAAENGAITTYNKYKYVTDNFYEFTGHKPDDEVRDIQNKDILLFRAKCMKVYQQITVNKKLQYLKYFFNFAFNNGKIPVNPFGAIKIKSKGEDKPFLTYEELCTIRDLQIVNDRLDKIRDVFLFLCFTGLEYADLINLKKEDVQKNSKNQWYIKKERIKTGVEYISVLYEDAVEIWELYDGNLPVVSNQKFNKYLKELAEMAGIDKTITTLTGRHSYATFLLSEKNIPIDIVRKMLGHTSYTQSLHYSKMLDNSVFQANKETKVQHREPTKAEIKDNLEDLEWLEQNLIEA